MVPSAVYLIQNNLLYVAASNLDVATQTAKVHLIWKISKKQKCGCQKNNDGYDIYIYILERICVSFKF